MSDGTRASRVRQHVHCDSCYIRRCKARVEVSVCCAVIPCRLLCGAVFHLCKEEDHLLLCPNARVPCLNAGSGCPLHMPRSSQAAHLQGCAASLVCCSAEWIRWPINETDPHSEIALQENVLKESDGQEQPLDLAMALVDQTDLYERLEMNPIYPELMEAEGEEKKEEAATGGCVNGDTATNEVSAESNSCGSNVVEQNGLGQISGPSKGTHNLCAAAQANQDNPKPNPQPEEREAAADTGRTGPAPWEEGEMERLGNELTPQEFDMYMEHQGTMLLAFGKIKACTAREDDISYGSLVEPNPVQTLHSFKMPVSYHYGERRVHYYDTTRPPSEPRSVDTSDLKADEEDWFSDEAAATLLGYAERDVRGHKISESKSSDGLFVDVGTQTHSFRKAPFKAKTTLAEAMVDRPFKLRLQLQSERVSGRNTRAGCAFTFLCGHTFHRREFATHFRNVHSDIQTSLSGWFEQRCPLSYLGCTFSQKRFQPSTHRATVSYNQHLRIFNLRPTLAASQPSRSSEDSSTAQRKRGGRRGGDGEDSLSMLPYEVLCHMASFLDSLSLSQLALVSQLMRQVSSSLLQDRGMVTLRWEKTTHSDGGAKWRATPVWEFSHLFSSVESWHMADVPPISVHLKVCPYYKTSLNIEPVPLPSISDKQECTKERLSLVNQFTGSSWQH